MDYQAIVKGKDYDFLRTDARLKNDIMLLTVGGSMAYGTNTENSDIDIRGIAHNSKKEILLGRDFSSYSKAEPDILIFSFLHAVKMLSVANPTALEMLFAKPEHILYVSELGKVLLENRNIFLSKLVAKSFGGYSGAQLRDLEKVPKEKKGKSAMHVIRLLYNGIHILEDGEFSTYSNEHDLLMDIRNGEYMDDTGKMKKEFYEMVTKLKNRMEKAETNTPLPAKPVFSKIENLTEYINEIVVLEK